jgi:hypothetical protein
MKTLKPKDAAARFAKGEILLIPIGDAISALGMTAKEFLPYLQSGDIQACVDIDGNIMLKSDVLVDWMVRHDRHLVKKSS